MLLAEDNESDRLLLQIAFRQALRMELIGMTNDGEEAIDYLAGRGQYADRQAHPFPDLLLLDLVMPRKTGFDVLKWLQSQSFPGLKVVVFTGVLNPLEIQEACDLGAQFVRIKPVDLAGLKEFVKFLEAYLLRVS